VTAAVAAIRAPARRGRGGRHRLRPGLERLRAPGRDLALPLPQDVLHHRLAFLGRHRPQDGQLLRHLLAQAVQELLEELEGLGLVLVQGVALRVAAEAHHRPQVLEPQEVLAPLGVDGLQQDLLLHAAHGLGAEGGLLLGHELVRGLDDPVAQHVLVHALLGRPGRHGQLLAELELHRLLKRVGLPLLGIGPGRRKVVDEVLHDLMAHVGDDLVDVLASMISRRWRRSPCAGRSSRRRT
jgi:hypothetical protein